MEDSIIVMPGQMIRGPFVRLALQSGLCLLLIIGTAVVCGETYAYAGEYSLAATGLANTARGQVEKAARVLPVQGVRPPSMDRIPDTWAFQSCISPHGYLVPRITQGKRGQIGFGVVHCSGNSASTSITVELSVVECPVDALCQLPKREVTVDQAGFHTSDGIVVVVDVPDTMQFGRYPLRIKGVSLDRTRYLDLAFDVTK